MTADQTADTAAPAEPVRAVLADGRWAIVQLMGYKTFAGRLTPDPILSGAVLVQTPGSDGVTLVREQAFNPSGPALYLVTYQTRQQILDHLYPPVRTQLALGRSDRDPFDDDPDQQDLDEEEDEDLGMPGVLPGREPF